MKAPPRKACRTPVEDKGRVCTKCLEFKLWSEFNKARTKQLGYSASCKACKNAKKRAIPFVATPKTKEQVRQQRIRLNKNDPLKRRSQQFRSSTRVRDLNVPVLPSVEYEQWLKAIDPFVCYYSNATLKHTDFSIDHKQPLVRGGTNQLNNLCICTKAMNTAKGQMTEKEFKQLLKLISKWEDSGVKLLNRLRMAGKAFGR